MSALGPRSGIQVSSVYPTYIHIKGACMCLCVCVDKPVAVELCCHATAFIMLLVPISFHAGFSVFTLLILSIYSRIRRNLPADTILETGIVVFN